MGNKQGSIRGQYNKWTDEQIIDAISKYETIKDLRLSEDKPFYFLALKRDLRDYLPVKRTKAMNIVGSALERKLLEKEKELLVKRECEKTLLEEPKVRKKPGRKPKEKPDVVVDHTKVIKSIQLYKHSNIEGIKVCGRCLTFEPKTPKSILCKDCQKIYARMHAYDKDHVPYNLKQDYCNTTIQHYEKTFKLGIKVDERLQNYLTLVGYGFLFQEPWEDMWKTKKVIENDTLE